MLRTSGDAISSGLAAAAAPAISQKLLGLEIIRFLAALSVLFWHYQNFWWTPHGLTGFASAEEPLYRLFSPFYEFGRYGVQVFWSISGYIFFWKYRAAIAGRRIGPRTFFVLRFSRLYPLHLVTLLLVAALQLAYTRMHGTAFVYGHNDWYHFMLQLFFASNWGFEQASSFNEPIWSISIEVLVYALFFVVLRFLGGRVLLNAAIIMAGLSAYMWSGHNPIYQCVVCFYVGGMSAIAAATPTARAHRGLCLGLALAILVVVAAVAALVELSFPKYLTQSVLIVSIALVVYVMAEHVRVPQPLVATVQTAGNMTYSSYLIHFPLQLTLALTYGALGATIPRQSEVFFACYLAAVLLLAGALYRFFELPCQTALRDRLAPRRREA